tara:strand:+ start:929 stop:1087 length:159 start_codon:yes stop_codon:yes gene_type:complete
MDRARQPGEVGPAYVFLASEDSSYITGQFIHINGGEPYRRVKIVLNKINNLR